MKNLRRILILCSAAILLGTLFFQLACLSESQKRERRVRKAYAEMRALLQSESFLKNPSRFARREAVKGVMADYDGEPRQSPDPVLIAAPTAPARVDVGQLVKHCEQLGGNCYLFPIWHQPTDWQDFQAFVLAAEESQMLFERNFSAWICLVPPSESQTAKSEPFGMDYIAWMENVAAFSADHPMVTAVCIDDFYGAKENRALFTKDYLKKMREAADQYNPCLALVTLLSWDDVDPGKELDVLEETSSIANAIDGILFPYMAQSLGKGLSHKDTSALTAEIQRVKNIYPGVPVIIDTYVSKHTACPDLPSPRWVGEMIDISLKNADGVALYAMPKKNKDGSFADFWITSMEDPAGIYEIVKSKYGAKR